MQFGICLLSLVPARKEPSGISEMVTQLFFGDYYSVIENGEDWLKIKTSFDGYECWISAKQHTAISETTYSQLLKNPHHYCSENTQIVSNKLNASSIHITIGAHLPFLKEGTMSFESHVFGYQGLYSAANKKSSAEEIIACAKTYLNAPYLWGGKSPFGIDCSGFTQTVFKLNGYKLPRDAYQQVELGGALSFVEESQAGDLAFFDNEEGRIVHVGILLNNEQIIHASGCVRIDKFDHYGIFNSDTKKYSHLLRVIKRVI